MIKSAIAIPLSFEILGIVLAAIGTSDESARLALVMLSLVRLKAQA